MFNFFKNLFNKGLTPQKALDLLTPIPKEDFTVQVWHKYDTEQCCTIGHLRRLLSDDPTNYRNASLSNEAVDKLDRKVSKYLRKKYHCSSSIIVVNDFPTTNGFTEDNPKDRIIHLLTEMSKKSSTKIIL